MISFTIEQKRIDVFPGARPNTPAIYLNTTVRRGNRFFSTCGNRLSGFFAGRGQQSGMGARYGTLGHSAYLGQRCALYRRSRWLPETSSKSNSAEGRKSIAGYPFLAGNRRILPGRTVCSVFDLSNGCLFTYCQYIRFPVVSWNQRVHRFPYASEKACCMYFSLGDRECHTRNKFLKCVQQNTEALESFYRQQGIDTIFRLNPGNHFRDGVLRTAAGLQWILEQRT